MEQHNNTTGWIALFGGVFVAWLNYATEFIQVQLGFALPEMILKTLTAFLVGLVGAGGGVLGKIIVTHLWKLCHTWVVARIERIKNFFNHKS